MLHKLTSHSPDLKRLFDEGYDVEADGGHLLVHQIPYVNPAKEIKYGTLVCVLTLASPTRAGLPQDHTMYFCGETPCDTTGVALNSIINNSSNVQLTEKILANHYFSSKPTSGSYPDYYEKFRTYSEILSAQARAIDVSVTTKPNKNKAA